VLRCVVWLYSVVLCCVVACCVVACCAELCCVVLCCVIQTLSLKITSAVPSQSPESVVPVSHCNMSPSLTNNF